MSNISKQNRDEMLMFLDEMSKNITDEDTLIKFQKIKNALSEKRYGLLWERHTEEVDEMLKDNIPVFTEDKSKEITSNPDERYNFLLEGDNLHSLKLLEKTHRGAIDVIYIDPPYNTGNKDFVYNDKTIDKEDGYRHSKWLSFMNERLTIARDLLSDNGVIFISIDDNELYQLKLLCDEIFGETNFISNIIWYKNNSKGNVKTISNVTEYILCYAKNIISLPLFRHKKPNAEEMCSVARQYFQESNGNVEQANKEFKKWLKLHDIKGGEKKYNKIDENGRLYTDKPLTAPGSKLFYDIIHPTTKKPCKTASRGWAYKESSLKALLESGHILFGKDETTCPYLKYFLDENLYEVPTSHIQLTANNAVDMQILGFKKEEFSYPKPITLIKQLLTFFDTKNAIVLDFFAGSGTTGHAVMELNQEDGGNRHFILCTNNENNICENITYQRLKTVITGIKSDGSTYSDGIQSNLKYFKTDFVSRNIENLPDELSEHCTEMIELQYRVQVKEYDDFTAEHIIVKSDEEVDFIEQNFKKYNNIKVIYYIEDTNEKDSVILTNAQLDLFKGIQVIPIPRWYFENEIKEVL